MSINYCLDKPFICWKHFFISNQYTIHVFLILTHSVTLYFCRYKPTYFKAEKTIKISFNCNSCQLFLQWLFQQSVVVFTVWLLVIFCFYNPFMWCVCICFGIVCPLLSYLFCDVLPPFVLYCTTSFFFSLHIPSSF